MLTSLPHDLYNRILAGSPDAILICDHTGMVRYWNAAAEPVFAFSVLEAVGASLDLSFPNGCAPGIGPDGKRR